MRLTQEARPISSLISLLALSSSLSAATLPPPIEARPEPDRARCAEVRALAARVATGATIEGEICRAVSKRTPWIAIVKRLDNLARAKGAMRVRFAAGDPGRTLVEGWRMRDGRGVVAAMLPKPGGGTVVYYQVRFAPGR